MSWRAGILALLLLVGPLAGVSSADGSDEDKKPVRRTHFGDTDQGSTEAGVSVTSLSALVKAGGPRSSGRRGGSSGDCQWAVAYNPNSSFIENSGAAGLSSLRVYPANPGSLASHEIGVSHDNLARREEHASLGGSQDLRYVYNYGSDCGAVLGAWITLAEIQAVAQLAFDDMKSRWPEQPVVLGWHEPVEDTWTALSTDLPWEPFSATASDNGITVTVTATPVRAVWEIGEVNGRYGGPTEVVCDGPGDMPRVMDDASCRVWFAGPSTDLADRTGAADRITLGLTVEWEVGYTSVFGSDPNWLVWPSTSELDGVRVVGAQVLQEKVSR